MWLLLSLCMMQQLMGQNTGKRQKLSEVADRVKRIVRDLRNFARMDDDYFEWSDLNDCIRSTVNLVRNEIKYDSELTLQLGEIPQVHCSRHQISQVILNLLVNAAHSIKKQGSITVSTTQMGDYVLLSVEDNGCGMSDEVRKRIFEPPRPEASPRPFFSG